MCRAAENRCEAAVRHADLIGDAADSKVTQAISDAAVAVCAATEGCAVSSGKCSCPCALLGTCNCACGGSFLRRCVFRWDLEIYNGRPAVEKSLSTLAPWGDALVAVRRASAQMEFVADPLPDPTLLIGANRNDIDSVLGTGRGCGTGQPSAPCQKAKQIFYAMYKRPLSPGGGPELLITFDDAGRTCSAASIVRTK
jgi:hypothetical protein